MAPGLGPKNSATGTEKIFRALKTLTFSLPIPLLESVSWKLMLPRCRTAATIWNICSCSVVDRPTRSMDTHRCLNPSSSFILGSATTPCRKYCTERKRERWGGGGGGWGRPLPFTYYIVCSLSRNKDSCTWKQQISKLIWPFLHFPGPQATHDPLKSKWGI